MEIDVNIDTNNVEVIKLEKNLLDLKNELESVQNKRSAEWRKQFLYALFLTIAYWYLFSEMWWGVIAVVGFFAGSLFMMLRQNAKEAVQINEYRQQIRLAKILHELELNS